jgi:hypothetical protein
VPRDVLPAATATATRPGPAARRTPPILPHWPPSRGRPAQPRISSGVHSRPTTVASSSACSGVFASPTARLTAVASHSRKNAGAASNSTRA